MNESSAWLGMAVLICSAMICAAAMRVLQPRHGLIARSGWAMLGGVIAGIILGPTLFGRLMPDQYEQWYLGGASERIERERIVHRHDADVLAALHAQADRSLVDQREAEYEHDLAAATQVWREAQWEHQAPARAIVLFMAACVLLYGGALSILRGDTRQGVMATLTLGVWSVALPGGLAYSLMTVLWGYAPAPAAMAAAALTIGPWMLTPLDREAADGAEFGGARMIQTAGRVASVLAIAAGVWALWSQRGIEGLLMGAVMLALPAGWLLRKPLLSLGRLVHGVFLPALAASVAIKIELIEDFSFWPMAVILLVSDDGRWLGAFCGAMLLGGRQTLRTMRLVVGSISAAVTQLTILAIATQAWAVPRQVVLPVILGSLLIDFTAGARRKLVQRLTQAEESFPDHLEP